MYVNCSIIEVQINNKTGGSLLNERGDVTLVHPFNMNFIFYIQRLFQHSHFDQVFEIFEWFAQSGTYAGTVNVTTSECSWMLLSKLISVYLIHLRTYS
jgi:hypothetical protein